MRYVTAGESHGEALCAIVSDVPAGIAVSEAAINSDLARRQSGYGRGGRQLIETDTVSVESGLRFGRTLGTPVTLRIVNRDHRNWHGRMDAFGEPAADLVREVTPRPGHADLVGALKIGTDDCRDILERASARETAARVAAAGIAREFLAELGVEIRSFVTRIGSVALDEDDPMARACEYSPADIEISEVRCPDPQTSERIEREIDAAIEDGESLGGEIRIVVEGLVPGLGSYASGPERLTSQLGGALFSIPAIKGVEFGIGFAAASRPGSMMHDPIAQSPERGFYRTSNNAGGLEGGMSNGMPLIATIAMKPIPTLRNPLSTVNMETMESTWASKERSDVCAVPAAGVVAEAEVAFVLADAYMRKFGADDMTDIKASMDAYLSRVRTMSH